MKYMLDTNICIYLGNHYAPQAQQKFASLSVGDAVMSSVVYGELRHGIERDAASMYRNLLRLEALTSRISVVDYDANAAAIYGRLAARIARRHRDAVDCMIAAHAIALEATLVTNNERDFVGYSELGGLRLENWVSE